MILQSIDPSFAGLVYAPPLLEHFWKLMLGKLISIRFCPVLVHTGSFCLITSFQIWEKFGSSSKLQLKLGFFLKDLQSITCEITLEDGTTFVYTAVYAANDEAERQMLWVSLRKLASSFSLSSRPWMINGDFNEILHPAETSNPSIVSSTRGMRLFGECLADLGVFDLPFRGPKFTWTNKRSSDPIGKKLDRCLVNGSWLLRFPSSHCTFDAPECSDHTPCHIKLVTNRPVYGTRPFKFFNLLAKHPQFLGSVKEAWERIGGPVLALKDFCFKLKKLKQPLKS